MDSSVEHVFSVEAIVRGYHEYQSVWDAPIGEMLRSEREVGNIHNTLAVAIMRPITIQQFAYAHVGRRNTENGIFKLSHLGQVKAVC